MESVLTSIKLEVEHCSKAFDIVKLPAKLLDQIIQYLNVRQLLHIRSTCRSWKETIDQSSAMNIILLKFPENLVLDRKYRPPALVPARNVCFSKSRISAVDSWWPSVGEKIVELRVDDCQISYAMLLKMLMNCSSLKSLEHLCSSYPAASVSIDDMKLDKMENLKIDNETMIGIVYDFVKMCPNLKTLKLPQLIDAEILIKHINVLKDILVEVNLCNFSKIINEMNQFKGLKCLHIGDELSDDQTLRTVAEAHPLLEGITIKIVSDELVVLSFLDILQCLQTLSIKSNRKHYGYRPICHERTEVNFTTFNGKNLRKLNLYRLNPVHLSLQQILKESSNLQEISLDTCHFKNWSEIFSIAEKHRMLQRLELTSVTVNNSHFCLSEYFDSLKFLRLVSCNLPKQLLVTFFSLCSELKDVVLESIPNVDDDVMLELLQSSERLKKLTLNKCFITDESVNHIAVHGLMIKKLEIINCAKITKEALKKLNIISN